MLQLLRRLMRVRLSVFLGVCLLCGLTIGLWGRHLILEPKYLSNYGRLGDGWYSGVWRVTYSEERLCYFVILPRGTSNYSMSCFGGSDPDRDGITCLVEGLYLDGERIAGCDGEVFVYTQDRTMRPVPLTPEERMVLTQENVWEVSRQNRIDAPIWRDKIMPIVEEEAWTAKRGQKRG